MPLWDMKHSDTLLLERSVYRSPVFSKLQHNLRNPSHSLNSHCRIHTSHESLLHHNHPLIHLSRIPLTPTTLTHSPIPATQPSTAHTPLVSLELSGTGSILGPTMPFSPGWFVPLSIPTFEMPESDATYCAYNIISPCQHPFSLCLSDLCCWAGPCLQETRYTVFSG